MKVNIPIQESYRMLDPGGVVLVTSKYRDRTNVMAASWATPLSSTPPLVGVAIHQGHFTHDLVKRSEEFALNIPWAGIGGKVKKTGEVSGWDVEDKFAFAGLTPADARYIEAPLAEECIGHLECALLESFEVGDHTLFVGQIVAATVEEEAFDAQGWLLEEEELKPLHYVGGPFYAILEKRLRI